MLELGTLARELAAVTRPVGEARGLPSALYTDAVALELERKRVFSDGWACIGLGSDAPAPSDVCPVDLLGMPLLLVRDKTGTLRVFENVCRHRGMILVAQKRNVGGVIRCPYHSWCYSHNGQLRATPHVGGPGINVHDSIAPQDTGLTPVRSGVFMDMVFVNISGTAPDFDTWIAPLRTRWADFADRPLHHAAGSGFSLDVACNWKLAIENYCESYHLPWVHPGLNSYSRLEDHYHIEHPGAFSGQGTRVYAPAQDGTPFPDFPELPKVWDRQAEYVALYPNVMVGIHRDHMFAIHLDPLAPDRTVERVEIYYTTPEAANGPDMATERTANAARWKEVFV